MRLTSMDISNKEFKKAMRGYDVDEVNDFLDKVSEDYESLFKENSSLKEKIEIMKEQVDHYKKMEVTIQNTLVMAQNAADQAKEVAQKQAEMILNNANDAAKKILDKGNEQVVSVTKDYDRVKQEFVKFKTQYRNFMNVQMEMFNSLEKEFYEKYSLNKQEQESDVVPKVETPKDSEVSIKDVKLDDFNDDAYEEIKNFFSK